MSAKEQSTGRKTGSRVTIVETEESKDERDRIRNAKRAEQQRVRRAKVWVWSWVLLLGLCLEYWIGDYP